MKPVLGIMLGDATGIGPEIVAKLVAEKTFNKYCRYVLIGDARVLALGQQIAGVQFPVAVVQHVGEIDWSGPVPILDQKNVDPTGLKMGRLNVNSGRATGDTIIASLRLLQERSIDGFVFAPINKQALKLGGYNYEDEHKIFAEFFHWEKPWGIMNVLGDLWTFRVTGHIPLSEVAASITLEGTLRAIRLAATTLQRAGYANPRIALAALNPHAGEGGLCGKEEVLIIGPAIKKARAEGIEALGPFSADTIFIKAFKGEYNAVVTMYHDQGQIATKLMGFEAGVTVSAGMPYPITTPEHGTAFDIAGKGIAKTGATENAVIIAAKMAGWREEKETSA
jgi:4-hydroxythreonine-4-phosphate dehydrogenase